MAKSKGQKFYAVAKGHVPGIYNTWAECEAQVRFYLWIVCIVLFAEDLLMSLVQLTSVVL
jgi:hypothetical protein